jgi:hypothetical protein
MDTPRIAPGKGPHAYTAQCVHCGSFIKWLSAQSPAEREGKRQQARLQAMAQKPPSPMQLAYLRSLGDSNPPPATMADASSTIDGLRQKGAAMSPALDALTTPFSLSVLTATKGNASKRLVPDAHGHPVKDQTHSLSIAAGHIEHVQVTGLTGFGDVLQRITPQQALVHGIPKGSNPQDIFELTTVEHYTGASGTLTRTLNHIDYPPGVRLLMCDYDPTPEAPEAVATACELVARLTGVWSAFAAVGWLSTVSTSSAIRDKLTHVWLRPPDGMHVYLLAKGDVARFRDLLKVRLWLAGTGYCKLATPNKHTGVASILERCLIDMTVFSPERFEYVAGAHIATAAPFFQDRPAPELHAGQVLDLDTLPDVTAAERADYARLVAEARARVAPEQRATVRAGRVPVACG